MLFLLAPQAKNHLAGADARRQLGVSLGIFIIYLMSSEPTRMLCRTEGEMCATGSRGRSKPRAKFFCVRSAMEALRLEAASQDDGERRFVLRDVGWEQYEALCGILDDSPGLRMTYLEGALELMSPSRRHEQHKKIIARLIEIYALERRISLNGFGSTTFRKRAKERGAEPDECYMIGEAPGLDDDSTPPHIAIEVVMTSSQIDKLSVYAGLQVPEIVVLGWQALRLAWPGWRPLQRRRP